MEPVADKVRQLYDLAAGLPAEDRLALIRLLFGTLRQEMPPNGNGLSSGPGIPREFIPRGVPVERILARPVPAIVNDAGIDELRWQHLAEKNLK